MNGYTILCLFLGWIAIQLPLGLLVAGKIRKMGQEYPVATA